MGRMEGGIHGRSVSVHKRGRIKRRLWFAAQVRGGRHGQEGWDDWLTLQVSCTAMSQYDSGHIPGLGTMLFSLSKDGSNRFSNFPFSSESNLPLFIKRMVFTRLPLSLKEQK